MAADSAGHAPHFAVRSLPSLETNLATLRDWPVLLTVVDLLWGMAVSVIISLIGFWAGGRLG